MTTSNVTIVTNTVNDRLVYYKGNLNYPLSNSWAMPKFRALMFDRIASVK